MSSRALFALPLIALAAVPPIIAGLESRSDTRFRELTVTRSMARGEAAALAARLEERVNALRNTLVLLRDTAPMQRVIQEGADCGTLLGNARAQLANVDELAVLDRTGRVRCSADPAAVGRIVHADAPLRQVLRGATDMVASGGVLRGRGQGLTVMVALRDSAGNGLGALAARTPLDKMLAAVGDDGRIAFVLDASGEERARTRGADEPQHDAADQALAEMRSFLHGRSATEVDSLGADGVRRVFGVLPSGGMPSGLTVIVGVPLLGSATAQAALGGTVALVTGIIAMLLAGALAWMFGAAPRSRAPSGAGLAAAGSSTEDAPIARPPEELQPAVSPVRERPHSLRPGKSPAS